MNLGWILFIITFIAWMTTAYGAGKAVQQLQAEISRLKSTSKDSKNN